MCLNCGCRDYWDKHGHSSNITMSDVEKAAEDEGMSVKDSINEMIDSLNEVKQAERK